MKAFHFIGEKEKKTYGESVVLEDLQFGAYDVKWSEGDVSDHDHGRRWYLIWHLCKCKIRGL